MSVAPAQSGYISRFYLFENGIICIKTGLFYAINRIRARLHINKKTSNRQEKGRGYYFDGQSSNSEAINKEPIKTLQNDGCKNCFFDAKPYDEDSFNIVNKDYNFNIEYFKGRLDGQTVPSAKGADVACMFVNGICDEKVVNALADEGVKLIALRCAGFNNVDVAAAKKRGIRVVRVPAYSQPNEKRGDDYQYGTWTTDSYRRPY